MRIGTLVAGVVVMAAGFGLAALVIGWPALVVGGPVVFGGAVVVLVTYLSGMHQRHAREQRYAYTETYGRPDAYAYVHPGWEAEGWEPDLEDEETVEAAGDWAEAGYDDEPTVAADAGGDSPGNGDTGSSDTGSSDTGSSVASSD